VFFYILFSYRFSIFFFWPSRKTAERDRKSVHMRCINQRHFWNIPLQLIIIINEGGEQREMPFFYYRSDPSSKWHTWNWVISNKAAAGQRLCTHCVREYVIGAFVVFLLSDRLISCKKRKKSLKKKIMWDCALNYRLFRFREQIRRGDSENRKR
jgi:hypothetical protein